MICVIWDMEEVVSEVVSDEFPSVVAREEVSGVSLETLLVG